MLYGRRSGQNIRDRVERGEPERPPAELHHTEIPAVPGERVMMRLARPDRVKLPVRDTEHSSGEPVGVVDGRPPPSEQLPAVPGGDSVPLVDVVALDGP